MEKVEKIGFFKRLFISIFKPNQYDKLSKQKTRRAIGTIVGLSFLQTIAIIALLAFMIITLSSLAIEKIALIPEFTISKDGLNMQMEAPIVYKTEDSLGFIVIDSNKTLEELKTDYSSDIFSATDYLIIAKDEIIVRSATEKENLNYGEVLGEESFTKQQIIDECKKVIDSQEFKTIMIVVAIIVSLILFVYFIISNIIIALIYSLIALIISNIQNKKIRYKRLFNISVYATVTAIILSIVQTATFIFIPFYGLIKTIIEIIYLVFGIKNCKNDGEDIINNNDNIIDSNVEVNDIKEDNTIIENKDDKKEEVKEESENKDNNNI